MKHTSGIFLIVMVGVVEVLGQTPDHTPSKAASTKLYVLNMACSTESNLILNSIEVNEKNTVIDFTFINTSLAYGDKAFIFAVIDDRAHSFYIEDARSKVRYPVYDATIGNSAKNPTFLKLGEAKMFRLFFPPIGNVSKINIREDMQGSEWSFYDIDLQDRESSTVITNNFFNNSTFQAGLTFLSEKEYAKAYQVIHDYAFNNAENDYVQNLAGIISYVLGNNIDALQYFKKASAIKPTEDQYYFNQYFLNQITGNYEEALEAISSAILLNSDQPEYFQSRAVLYLRKKKWREALNDLDRFIDSDRTIPGMTYFYRGVAKFWLQDNSACIDFKKAYSLAEDEKDKELISGWHDKHCK